MLELLTLILMHLASAEGAETPAAKHVDFRKDIQPILERRCQPCHFPGGKMHERLPFDRPETILHLNTKLFTRIRKEEERAVIQKFLDQSRTEQGR